MPDYNLLKSLKDLLIVLTVTKTLTTSQNLTEIDSYVKTMTTFEPCRNFHIIKTII